MKHVSLNRTLALAIALAAFAAVAILLLNDRLAAFYRLPDQGAAWYYWKLADPTFWTRFTAWGGYLAHQFLFWGLIWWGQRHRDEMRDKSRLHRWNVIGLIGTFGFVALHYLQTAIWYDGLAQDTSIFSSQGSVILLLIIVLMIEAPRRGLAFGRGGSWLAPVKPVLIRTHGYIFAWATVYTFWYHPMETTWGHLLGFFYTTLLMVQGTFAFTAVHKNRWWTLALELGVLIHGVTVALVAGQEFWTMFFFGFATIFVVTQMHGLGLGRWTRLGLGLAYLAGIAVVYSGRGWVHLEEVLRIPIIDYGLVLLLGGILLWITRKVRGG